MDLLRQVCPGHEIGGQLWGGIRITGGDEAGLLDLVFQFLLLRREGPLRVGVPLVELLLVGEVELLLLGRLGDPDFGGGLGLDERGAKGFDSRIDGESLLDSGALRLGDQSENLLQVVLTGFLLRLRHLLTSKGLAPLL